MAVRKVTKKKKISRFTTIKQFFASERTQFLIGVFIAFIAAYILLAMISFFFTGEGDQSKVVNKGFGELLKHKNEVGNWTGVVGAFIAETLINSWYGIASFVIPLFIGICGLRLMKVVKTSVIRSFVLSGCFLIWGSVTAAFALTPFFGGSHIVWGGSHGQSIEAILKNALGIPGIIMVILVLLIVFIVIVRATSVQLFQNVFLRKKMEDSPSIPDDTDLLDEEEDEIADKPQKQSWFASLVEKKKKAEQFLDVEKELAVESVNDRVLSTSVNMGDDFEIVYPESDAGYKQPEPLPNTIITNQETLGEESQELIDGEQVEDFDPKLDLSSFAFPSTDLLRFYDNGAKGVDFEEQKENKEKIITTLRNYGIEITSIKATVGPTITLYEIVPQAGVRISKIRNLEDDIALSLSALGIRIIAPMPGKGTIGIEVPNKDPQIVSMQSVIASKRFQECTYDLPVALGKTITNEIFMFDLCKMPHLLVAGATGQGKSVGLNAIITSLLYKKHPAEMKMVLVDPKMVEFNIYSTIEKHYLAKLPDAEKAIITDVTKVTQTLNSLTKEMDDRYGLLMEAHVRTIKEYNEKFKKRKLNPLKGHRFLPYIVVIIDEFGDLIMTAGKEIEMPIARIAQKARAVGIHMIIATQRPTTNIITGTIKANFPARMAFRVTSQIDSRTILDMAGANQLIGRGDLLFSQGSDLVRIQCAFVDTPEVEGIAQYIGNQRGYSHAFELPEYLGDGGDAKLGGDMDLGDKDPLFDEAARLIVVHQQGSTSLIQRKFSIGYNRAGRLMDQLERAGIVGPTQGSKPREVLIGDEYHLEQMLNK
ncbi:MAG: ftsK [Bacteroidetes bacterium]|nr:ftsK [Bacteroidota bacterium]